jgi:hypothetical protein
MLNLILADDTHCLKHNFVVFHDQHATTAVPKALIEASKIFDPAIESFMSGSCPTFKMAYVRRIMRIGGANDFSFTPVSLVTDDQLSDRNFIFQTFCSEDGYVVLTGRKGTIHPNQFVVIYRHS